MLNQGNIKGKTPKNEHVRHLRTRRRKKEIRKCQNNGMPNNKLKII